MDRVDPRDEADLLWLWNDAEGEIKMLRSLHEATVQRLKMRSEAKPMPPRRYSEKLPDGRTFWHRTEDVGYRGVYVPNRRPPAQTSASIDGRALAAAGRERRILRSLAGAGPEAELVLRLRFREVLPVCRMAFGGQVDAGARSLTRVPQRRGSGSAAHLTDAAQAAHGAARTTLGVARWTDRLGNRLAAGKASEADRELQKLITRAAEKLVVWAWERYRGGVGRVPERLKRSAA